VFGCENSKRDASGKNHQFKKGETENDSLTDQQKESRGDRVVSGQESGGQLDCRLAGKTLTI